MIKFKAKIVSDKPTRTACRPCSVIKKSDGRVLANFESRKACAIALGVDSPTISVLINGGYGYTRRIVDDKHGELQVVDGIREIAKPTRKKKPPVAKPIVAVWPYAISAEPVTS